MIYTQEAYTLIRNNNKKNYVRLKKKQKTSFFSIYCHLKKLNFGSWKACTVSKSKTK